LYVFCSTISLYWKTCASSTICASWTGTEECTKSLRHASNDARKADVP
jgi:hypothetical protein